MNIKWAEKLRKGLHGSADSLGNLCVEAFHYLALFGIGAITAYAAVVTFLDMLGKGGITKRIANNGKRNRGIQSTT